MSIVVVRSRSFIVNISPYLANIFNQCIETGTFPNLMKISKVVLLFKSGCRSNLVNYLVIYVLPSLSKILQKILLKQLVEYFKPQKILYDRRRSGFTKSKSTTGVGVTPLSYIFMVWEGTQDAIVVFCDLSKAFDCLDHSTPILKLKHYSACGSFLDFIFSYLKDRCQKMSIKGQHSRDH